MSVLARLLRSTRVRIVAAFSAVVAVLVIGGGVVGEVYSSTLKIGGAVGYVTFSKGQPNLAECVDGVKGNPQFSSPGRSPIRTVKLSFDKKNSCLGVELTVTVVDENGRISAGTLDPLPFGAKNNVTVTMDSGGEARKDDDPEAFVIVS